MISRRDLLKYFLSTPLAATLDYEKLLWVPTPHIVVPEAPKLLRPNYSQIVALAWVCRDPKLLPSLFERDDVFYKVLERKTFVEHEKVYNRLIVES